MEVLVAWDQQLVRPGPEFIYLTLTVSKIKLNPPDRILNGVKAFTLSCLKYFL
jgi:hypothetical protein